MKTKRKPKKTSPTARTLAELRKQGFYAWVVESVIPHTFIKRDFMGWADVIYLTDSSIVGVQVTSGDSRTSGGDSGNRSARRAKILAEPRALAWIKAGGIIEIHSWAKVDGRWVCRKEELVAADFPAEVVTEEPHY